MADSTIDPDLGLLRVIAEPGPHGHLPARPSVLGLTMAAAYPVLEVGPGLLRAIGDLGLDRHGGRWA